MSTGSFDNELCSSYYNLSLGDDPFYFQTTPTISRVHRNAIRFGKTSDISVLYRNDTTRADKNEYLVGVTTTSIVIFACITAWFALILICMCLGPDRVGFFSGRQRKIETTRDTNEPENDEVLNRENDTVIPDPLSIKQGSSNVLEDDNDAAVADSATDGEKDKTSNDDKDVAIAEPGITASEKNGIENKLNEETAQDGMVIKSLRYSLPDILDDERAILYRARLINSRIVVLMCSVGVVVSIILFISFGVQNLIQSSTNVIAGMEEGQELTREAIMLLDNFLFRQKMAFEVINPYLMDINGICPNVTQSICSDITNSSTCDFEDIPVSDEFEAAFIFLIDNVNATALEKADEIRSDLNDLNEELGRVADKIASFNWAFAIATVFAVLLLITNLVISYGIIVAWRRETYPPKYNSCTKVLDIARHWLMVPIFVFLVVMSWIFSMVFIIGSIATADLCYGSPDDTVLALIQEDIIPLDSIVQKLLIFYVEGCPNDGVPEDLTTKVTKILDYAESVSTLASSIYYDGSYEAFVETCGNDTSILNATAYAIQGTVCNVGATLAEIVLFFSCPNWSKYIMNLIYLFRASANVFSLCYSTNRTALSYCYIRCGVFQWNRRILFRRNHPIMYCCFCNDHGHVAFCFQTRCCRRSNDRRTSIDCQSWRRR